MIFSWIGFKIVILEPVKKFARDFSSEITIWVSLVQEYGVVSSA